jgi:peptide/nickel transport system substrate-binding protein
MIREFAVRPYLRRASLGAATLLLLAATGCGTDSGRGTGGGTLIVSYYGDAATLFPYMVQDEIGKMVTDLLFDHLAEIGDDMNTLGDGGFQPRLAKGWDWAKDSMSITYHIDPAARFHDGVRVTAKDVKFSLKILNDPTLATGAAPLVTNIDSVHVADSLTAVFYFKRHTPEEFYDVAYQIPIIPEHVYGKVTPAALKTSDLLRNPVGTGRFRFVRWEASNRIELIADTANYRGRAKLDRVVILLGQAPDAAASAVLAGESDFFIAFPLDQAARLDSSKVVRGIPNIQLAYGFLGFRVHDRKSATKPHPIFSDPVVRRAISMSLDRSAMLSNLFNGKGIPSHGPFPAQTATADTTIRLPAFDTAAARSLLESDGWKPGPNGIRVKNGRLLKFEVMAPASSSIRLRYADLIQEQLRRVGIQMDVSKVEPANFTPRQDAGDFDAVLAVINTDPSVGGTKEYWASEGVKTGTNFLGYSNPKVDALLDSAGRIPALAALKPVASRAYQAIADDAPAVWLYNLITDAAVNRRFETAPFRADGWWAHLADWSVPPDKRIDRDRLGLSVKTP